MRFRGVNLLSSFKMFTLFASSFLDLKFAKPGIWSKRSSDSVKKQTSSISFFFSSSSYSSSSSRKLPFLPPKTFAPLLTHRKSRPVSQFAQSTLTSPILILMWFVRFPLNFHQGVIIRPCEISMWFILSSYPFESKTTPSKSSRLR